MTHRTKAERAVDEAAAELRRLLSEEPEKVAEIRVAQLRLDRAWRAVHRLREALR